MIRHRAKPHAPADCCTLPGTKLDAWHHQLPWARTLHPCAPPCALACGDACHGARDVVVQAVHLLAPHAHRLRVQQLQRWATGEREGRVS